MTFLGKGILLSEYLLCKRLQRFRCWSLAVGDWAAAASNMRNESDVVKAFELQNHKSLRIWEHKLDTVAANASCEARLATKSTSLTGANMACNALGASFT